MVDKPIIPLPPNEEEDIAGYTDAQKERYLQLRFNGTGHKMAMMLAEEKAPGGVVKGSQFPTRSWGERKQA